MVDPTETPASRRPAGRSRKGVGAWSVVVGLALASALLVAPLGAGGAWDPFEIDAADRARRVAVHALGASWLARAGDPGVAPTLGDLGAGELPTTAMAAAFRWLGVDDWVGRLPNAAFGVLGALAVFTLLARTVGRRAGLFAALVLVTMPVYLLHARTMVGEAALFASFAWAVTGLGLAAIERGPLRAAWLLAGVAGLASGYLTRGALLGVAVPCLGVGLAALVAPGSSAVAPSRRGLGAVLLAVSAALALWFYDVAAPRVGGGDEVLRFVGMRLDAPVPRDATFDRLVRQLGHGLFPWSALAPLAMGALLGAPPPGARAHDSFLRLLLASSAGAAFVAGALVVPWAGPLPFVGLASIAGAIGLAFTDLERGGRPSRPLVLATVALTAVLALDLARDPGRTLAAFAFGEGAFPASLGERTRAVVAVAGAGFAGVVALVWHEAGPPRMRLSSLRRVRAALRGAARARARGARALAGTLVQVWSGNLVFGLVLVEAAFVGLGAMVFVGGRLGWASLAALPRPVALAAAHAVWAAPVGVVALVVVAVAVRDALRALVHVTGMPRGRLGFAMALVVASVLGLGHYPALAAQLSPREVFQTYRALAAPGDELALLRTSPRAGAFYAGREVERFEAPEAAFRWLVAPAEGRRFLVLKARDFPKLASLHRGLVGGHLPVLDMRSTENVLVSNTLGGAPDQNPLRDTVLDAPPVVAHPVDAEIEGRLRVIGWEIVDEGGRAAPQLVPGRRFVVRLVLQVVAPIDGNWQVFLHVDGQDRRHNADHPPLGGSYATNLWQPGDVIVDEHALVLEPNFSPGRYWLFFGFYDESGRMSVTRGDAQDDRVQGGPVEVR